LVDGLIYRGIRRLRLNGEMRWLRFNGGMRRLDKGGEQDKARGRTREGGYFGGLIFFSY